FDGVFVPDGRLVDRRPYDPVAAHSGGLRGNGSLALGVGRRCCALIGPSPPDDELDACRADLDAPDIAGMPAARARASEFAARAAHYLTVQRGSRSALAGDDAERLGRDAGLLLVYASRPAIKDALLVRFAGGGVRTPA